VNLNQTMTSVGTPIYVVPEVMAGNHYDSTADSYSFGICLVAMIRAEKEVMEFYFQALRKTMKRKTKKGVGITILNNRIRKGWRPLLPLEFDKSYPKLCKLLKRCWTQKPEDRPSFDNIVRVMQSEVADEVRGREEPVKTVYSVEDEAVYQERVGVDEDFEDDEGMDTTVGRWSVSGSTRRRWRRRTPSSRSFRGSTLRHWRRGTRSSMSCRRGSSYLRTKS